jgi:hypothetical protein
MNDVFEHLSDEQRCRAEALTEQFRAAGSEAPEDWALSEVEDDVPQLARFLFLRRMWRGADEWELPPALWFAEADDEPAEVDAENDDDEPTLVSDAADEAADGEPAFAAAQQAVARLLAAGADPADLREVARAVFVHAFYDALAALDDGFDPQAPEGTPGWLLTEVSCDLVATGRVLDRLHEDLFNTEPDA